MFRNCHIKKSLFSSYYDSYMIHVHTWAYSSYHVHIWYELCYLLNFFINESTVSSKRDCWAHLKESSKQIWSCFWSRSSSDCFKINYLKQTNKHTANNFKLRKPPPLPTFANQLSWIQCKYIDFKQYNRQKAHY